MLPTHMAATAAELFDQPSDPAAEPVGFDAVDALDTYADTVYRLAYARTGSHADAEDVLQEVFLRLLRARPRFETEEHRKAWLLRVTLHCAASFHRTAFRRRTVPLEAERAAPSEANAPGEEDYSTPLEVLDAVCRLPEKYRVVVHLFYYEDRTVAQIAALIGAGESTVKSRLHRARGLLRGMLKGELFHER